MRNRWLAAVVFGAGALALAAAAGGSGTKSGGTFRLGTSSRIRS
jgi:hypothetical protein